MLSRYERGFLEAAIDGEGCLGLYKIHRLDCKRKFTWDVQFYISNTNLVWLEKIQGILEGGTIHEHPRDAAHSHWRLCYRLDIPSKIARRILPQIKLTIKEKVQALVMETLNLLSEHNRWNTSNDERLEEIYDTYKRLRRDTT